jgi:tRNA pseudouridine32 synthase/23S rRNA pseudouridine746 synthase
MCLRAARASSQAQARARGAHGVNAPALAHDPDMTALPQPAVGAAPDLCAVHADAHLLAIVKPAGLLAVPGKGEAGQLHLCGQVQMRWPDALVVHRLDMATSGLMLFARGAAMQRALSALFESRAVHKRYEAWVHGRLDGEAGEITLPLAADWPNRPRQRVDARQGRPALTRWRMLARDTPQQRTRLALEPVTGRTHQLRVHLAALGHAIVGDRLYGPEPASGAEPRLLLHATTLRFVHPATGETLVLSHPAPF